MMKFSGKPVYSGIVMGNVAVLRDSREQVRRHRVEDVESEIARVQAAIQKTAEQLAELYEKAQKEGGESSAAIVEVQQMMLEDEGYLEDIKDMIAGKCNAEYAVNEVGNNYSQMFAGMDDDYMKARSADVLDISKRIINNLAGTQDASIKVKEPVILLADDLTPSETIQMDKSKILAFVTIHGSANSHTAILARSMNLPSMVGTNVELLDEYHGKMAVVDGFSGEFLIDRQRSFFRI